MASNATTTTTPPILWTMSSPVYISAIVIILVEILSALFANALLIVTICHSPSLKTPPNAQLVSICVNNLLLSISAIISLCSLLNQEQNYFWDIINDMQMFISLNSLLQYWCIFSAIGFYRNKILERPSMSLRLRRRIIHCSIWMGWLTSVAASLLFTLSYKNHVASVNWNPFRRSIDIGQLHYIESPTAQHMILLFLISMGFLVGIFGILMSYQRIFKTLYAARPLAKNRVAPFTVTRASSLSSDDNDMTFSSRRSYRPAVEETGSQRSSFTISNGNITDDMVVHYQRYQDALTFEICALENPLQFQGHHIHKVTPTHRHLRPTLSNVSNTSTRSRIMEFNDISPVGELNRIQNIKNSTALWSQSLRRDRVSLKSAARNSLVMLATYVFLSVPYILCSLPGVLSVNSVGSLTIPLLYSRLLFYLNAPAYPIWYLVFSGRVRKCLSKLIEHVLISLNLKK